MKKLATIITFTVALALSLAFVACEDNGATANDSHDQSVSSSALGGNSSTEQGGGSSSGSSGQGGDSTEINDLSQYTNTLYVEDNKDFVILNVTDFQLHDGKSTYTAFDIIDTLVDNYHPDLITVLGDTAEDDGTYGTKVNFKAIVDHIDALGIPWAPVYGNHDNDNYREQNSVKDVTSTWINDTFLSAQNCLFKVGPTDVNGNGNYIVNVVEKNSGKIRKALYFFDTGTQGVDSTHVSFYADAVSYCKGLNGGTTPESICFMHIPLPEYSTVYYSGEFSGIAGEKPSVGSGTTDFFAKIKELGSTTHVICGHDHINSFYAEYEGVYLMYALKSSDGDYYNNLQLGGMTFNIGAQTTFEYHYMNSAFEVSNKTGFNLDHLYGWKYSGATLCFDIKPTDTVTTDNTVKFSILGDNIRRLSVSLKDRNGEWNRLSAIMTIDLNAMTADHGTLTEKGDGWYSYKLDLSETPLNNNGGEVAYGDETLKMMYFSYVGHSFCFANVSYELDQVTETNQKDLAGATIEPIPDQDYTGKPLFPELTVKYEDETLVFGEDYLVEYSDNDAGGTATVTITPSGVGAHKWKGEKSATFNIVAPEYVVRGDYFVSADNKIYDVDPKAYSTVTFDYYIVSGESFGIALINKDWGSNYFGYLKFNSDGAVESYAGVSCVKCADGYVSVTINMSELTKAVGTPSDKVVRTLFISKNQGDASGYIDKLSFNE